MTTNSWKGGSGDWSNAADWSTGIIPGAADNVSFAGAGAYTVTLYGAGAAANMSMNAPGMLFYDAGTLTIGGTFSLQAGTFDLAYGTLRGGVLALAGGTFSAMGGTLDGVAVQGTLDMSATNATLFVTDGLNLTGVGGVGAGSLNLTGNNAALDFIGSQSLGGATVAFGVAASQGQGGASILGISHAYNATAGATLTLGSTLWLRETGTQATIQLGGPLASAYSDAVVNQGTITAATAGATLTLAGSGNFINQSTIGVSNGATLDIASGGFTNTGTIVVSNATLALGGIFASSRLANLGPLSLSQSTVEIVGVANNAGATLSVGATSMLGPIALAGTIAGGTILDSGGGLSFGPGTGMLDGVAYIGTLNLSASGAAVTLDHNTTLSAAGGGAGVATVTGAGAALLFEGTTSLDRATITLGGATVAAIVGTVDPFLASNATTATFGSQLLIQQSGKFAAIDANGTVPIAGYGLADTILAEGTIVAAVAGGTLDIGGVGIFINAGRLSVSNGDTLAVTAAVFSNTGTLAVSGGATAVLGGPPTVFGTQPTWSNTGVISVNGGTLVLAGAMQTAQLGTILDTGGLISLAGTLANGGTTLSLGAGGIVPAMTLTGTIVGGTISDAAAALSIGAGGTALLDGVAYQGTIGLGAAGAYLRIRDGLTLSGGASVTGAGATLAFQGSQTFDKAQVALGSGTIAASVDVSHDYGLAGGSTLTLGPSLTITQTGALATIGNAADLAGDAVVSYARVTGSVTGGTLTLAGAGFTNRGSIAVSNGDTLALTAASFSNLGSITVSGATLAIADALSLGALGNLTLSNGAVSISGTLDATGGTLALGAGTAWGRLNLSGTLRGGTIIDAGGGLAASGNATLDGVSYRGTLDLSRPFQSLTVTNGLLLTDITGSASGTILLTGAASKLTVSGSETLNAAIYLGSATQTYYGQHVPPPDLAVGPDSTLTLGTNTLVRSAGLVGWLGDSSVGHWTDTIVNNGVVLAATPGGILTVGSTFFVNGGGLAIGNNGNAMFTGVSFLNTGSISLNGGSNLLLSLYGYYSAPNAGPVLLSNSGTIRMLGGVLQELSGGGLFPYVPIANLAGGTIQGLGNIIAPLVNNGTVESKYGPVLDLTQAISGLGTLLVDPGCVLELGGPVGSGQTLTFSGAGETLRLDNSAAFAASVTGYGAGDVIDLAGTPVNTIAISAGTLVAGTSYGQFRLASTAPLGGELSVGADTHGGSTIAITPQTIGGGGGPAVIAAGQPNMVFWASPVGDVFTGTAANLAGATLANWTTTDSFDLVDMLGTQTRVAYVQATGQGTLTVSDGTHSASLLFLGTYNAASFHVSSDTHGGAIVSYGH